jgi:hypothetical protein
MQLHLGTIYTSWVGMQTQPQLMLEQIGTYIWVTPLFLLYACQWYTLIHHGGHHIHKWHTHDGSVEEIWVHVEDCTHGQATSTPALQTKTEHIIHSPEAVLQQLPIAHVHQACKCSQACFLSEALDKLTGEHHRMPWSCSRQMNTLSVQETAAMVRGASCIVLFILHIDCDVHRLSTNTRGCAD